MNLLQETIRTLADYNKTPKDVLWVGGSNESTYPHRISWDQFAKRADFDYDSTSYPTTISPDLIIVGEDFWLERFNSGGYENWVYRTSPDIRGFPEGDICIKA